MSKLTKDIHKKYSLSLGPEQIASPKALRIIEHFTKKFIREIEISTRNNHLSSTSLGLRQDGKPSVEGGAFVEIGSGIGTITDLISTKIRDSESKIPLICYEINDFCINQLKRNVDFNFILIKRVQEISSCNLEKRKTLLIIDDYISDSDTQYLLGQLNLRYVIIEGHRFRQRIAVAKSLLHKSISIRFFGNSMDSVKGACVITVGSESRNVLTYLGYWRLILQSSLLVRKLFQAVGIRKKKFLNFCIDKNL